MNSGVYDIESWDRKGNCYVYPDTPKGFTFETEVHGTEEIEVKA